MKEATKDWLEKAESDLDNASFAIKGKRNQLGAFLLQQTIEKALKALHIEEKDDFDKTHNLVKLAKDTKAPKKFNELFEELTATYTGFRYPDVPSDEVEDVKEKLEETEELIKWTKKQLNKQKKKSEE